MSAFVAEPFLIKIVDILGIYSRKRKRVSDPGAFNVFNLLLTSNLVSHSLGLNDSDVINDSLVEVEILGHPI